MADYTDFEPNPDMSQTGRALEELQLFGYRAFDDFPDPRPLPDAEQLIGAVSDIVDALVSSLTDTRMEPDLEPLLWSTINAFHRSLVRIEGELDDNELAQMRGQAEQDGSEIRASELDRLILEGKSLIERRDAFEMMRDHAAQLFGVHTGSPWRPRAGSMVNHRHLTSSLVDSRDFIKARRQQAASVLVPQGPKIAFSGGQDYNDVAKIWDVLDRALAKHADMVLIHGGGTRGAELIAAKWADHRKVSHIAFKPDWSRHGRSSPFKRNDLMLETLPIGVIIFPGNGIQDSLRDKAVKLGLPVWRTGSA